MDIGIGLPSTIPGVTGRQVLQWATAAEQAGFSTLGTIDRVVYPSLETVATLAAAAAVTERIRLTSAILIAPNRGNGALLAKQLATVDRFADGRLTAGVAVGGRQDDYTATGASFQTRGRDFDAQLAEMRAVWAQEERGFAGAVGPAPATEGGPPLLLGGTSPATFRRMAEYGAGWICGGGGAEVFAAGAEQARRAWREAGRPGEPRLVVNGYFSLGPDGGKYAEQYLGDYYAFLGDFAKEITSWAFTSPEAVATTPQAFADSIAGYAAAGCQEIILFPCNPDPAQIALLAEAAGL